MKLIINIKQNAFGMFYVEVRKPFPCLVGWFSRSGCLKEAVRKAVTNLLIDEGSKYTNLIKMTTKEVKNDIK